MIRPLDGKSPRIHHSAFISEAAYIVGDVVIGEGTSIWPGAVIRAEMKVELLKNVYLEGSWRSDETTREAYGNFGLDLNLELDFD